MSFSIIMETLAPNLFSIELFWRAANYLSAGMLYLKDNPLLRNELRFHHFKQIILGHWGACPGINAIYAHASDLSRRTGQRMRLIVGSGHAGPAILSNLYLEGSLEKIYPKYTRDLVGMTNLFNAFADNNGFHTEITPHYPGMIYFGGELGTALAFSQGYALNNPDSFSICVIGDGELETSITQAAWQGFKFLSSTNDGKILPVINANGYKMGSKSLYALKPRKESEKLFKGYGLTPIFVGTNHQQIAAAFNKAYIQLSKINTSSQPIIILESPKGWTAPEKFGNRLFSGSQNAHKPILKNPSNDINELEMIKTWLMSYIPSELFDDNGAPLQDVVNCLPDTKNHFGLSNQIDKCIPMLKKKSTPDSKSSIDAISNYLVHIIKKTKDVIVFSPDELSSNKFDNILKITRLKYGTINNLVYSTKGRVIEILNEHLCYAWAQGYSIAGHHAVIISYEAFAPIFDSMAAQHLKFLKASTGLKWHTAYPSVNIILTSLGWDNNPTHHNPSFVDNLIGRNVKEVKIYMPVTAETTTYFFNEMIESYNRLNIMVMSKRNFKRIPSAFNSCTYNSWRVLQSDSKGNPRISLIAIGDRMAEESLFAKDIINSSYPDFFVRVLVIEDLDLLEYSKNNDIENFKSVIADSSSCIWVYNGYPKTIKGLLWDLGITTNTKVLGYKDNDLSYAGPDRLNINEVSRFHIAKEAIKLLFPKKKIISLNTER
jgi:xylulose-5-phosphate/fructose-6-phosphate phosphoketolase